MLSFHTPVKVLVGTACEPSRGRMELSYLAVAGNMNHWKTEPKGSEVRL